MIRGMKRVRKDGPPSPLDAAHAAFIQGGVSVVIASRDAVLVPDLLRGCGCRVSRDRRRVTVLFDRTRSDNVLDDVVANGRIAVVFSQPSTHQTIQLKGADATPVRTTAADLAIVAGHRELWVQDLCRAGYDRAFATAIWGALPQALAAVTFTPTAAFQQTPGPAAGQPLGR
jgi:hypothetical protein